MYKLFQANRIFISLHLMQKCAVFIREKNREFSKNIFHLTASKNIQKGAVVNFKTHFKRIAAKKEVNIRLERMAYKYLKFISKSLTYKTRGMRIHYILEKRKLSLM